jgi:hypothetical protein
MTDSTIDWIRNEFLSKKYGQAFTKRKLSVQSGGEFECDAVSEDGKIVCFISTSVSTTTGENPGLTKIREVAFWAVSLSEKPEIIVFACTEKSMVELIKKEQGLGRFPKHIKTQLVKVK